MSDPVAQADPTKEDLAQIQSDLSGLVVLATADGMALAAIASDKQALADMQKKLDDDVANQVNVTGPAVTTALTKLQQDVATVASGGTLSPPVIVTVTAEVQTSPT